MKKYELKELPAFSVLGLEQVLTNQKSQNLERCLSFWPAFNRQLKMNRLTQQKGNWTKFAFMERRAGQLYYYCGIPRPASVPVNFLVKEIPAGSYLVVEHRGSMDLIYVTYEEVYQELVPKLDLSLKQTSFFTLKNMGRNFIGIEKTLSSRYGYR